MSGILGTIQTMGNRIDHHTFKAMLDALHQRGPDGIGVWHNHIVGLGHRMLRTTPEAHLEKLPWHDVETGCVIISDARLDNRYELIDALGKNSFKMESIPDSSLILRSYQKWGNNCVHRLLGDFSFALWDINKQQLFCARDFLGVKPFHYCFLNGLFLFCSEARVIAKYSGLPFNVNEPRIADSLTPHLEGYDTTSTFYKEIFKLPPAHTLEFKNGHVHINRYWQPEPKEANVYKSDNEYREALTEILTRAVADRCRGAKDPVVLLSGGVDSAAVMGIAQHFCRDVSGGIVHGYSGISEDIADCKESRMIAVLSGSGEMNHHLYTPNDLSKHLDPVFDLVSQLHEPFDFGMILHFLLYQQAAKDGSRVMLDGIDGDIAASLPYNYPAQLLRQFAFKAVWHETRAQGHDFFAGKVSPYKLLLGYFLSAFTPQIVKEYRWRLRLPAMMREYLAESVAAESFAGKVGLRDRLLTFERTHRKQNLSFPDGVYLNRVQHPFLNVGLERYDRVASLCSIEPRHPLLDKRLIDFYMGLPWNQFMREGWSKYLFRRVAEQFVPKEVCWRAGKEHMGWQFAKKMLQFKQDAIYQQIVLQEEKVNKMIKSEFTSCRLRKDGDNKESHQTAIHPDVAGLVLWLNNI
ncbi:MAG: asparagine synthase-related protein [Pseudomonadota bacterium]